MDFWWSSHPIWPHVRPRNRITLYRPSAGNEDASGVVKHFAKIPVYPTPDSLPVQEAGGQVGPDLRWLFPISSSFTWR